MWRESRYRVYLRHIIRFTETKSLHFVLNTNDKKKCVGVKGRRSIWNIDEI